MFNTQQVDSPVSIQRIKDFFTTFLSAIIFIFFHLSNYIVGLFHLNTYAFSVKNYSIKINNFRDWFRSHILIIIVSSN
jgi:hypothetical protein